MVTVSGKKTPSKATRSPSSARRTRDALKGSDSPSPTKRSASGTPKKFTSCLPTEEQRKSNGRVSGRNLIIWSRPRMTEKLLLHIVYECQRHRVALPWNAIAHRFHPGSSGTAVNQHIQRLRKDLIAEGHLVPPPTGKSANEKAFDNELRGYIRADLESHDRETVRPVLFDEVMDDRKFNLPDAFDMEDDEPGSFGESDSEDQYEDDSESIKSPLQGRGKGSAGFSPRTRRTSGHQNTRRAQVIDDEEHGIESFEERMLRTNLKSSPKAKDTVRANKYAKTGEDVKHESDEFLGVSTQGLDESELDPDMPHSPYGQSNFTFGMSYHTDEHANAQVGGVTQSPEAGVKAHAGLRGTDSFLPVESPMEAMPKDERDSSSPDSFPNNHISYTDDFNAWLGLSTSYELNLDGQFLYGMPPPPPPQYYY